MRLLANLGVAALLLSVALTGCGSEGGVNTAALPATIRASLAHALPASPSAVDTGIEFVYLVSVGGPYQTVTEYGATSPSKSPPLRTFRIHSIVFGVDHRGNLYSAIGTRAPYGCTFPCKVVVFNPAGKVVRSFDAGAARFPYVDGAGHVYAVTGECGQIVEYPAGATGTPTPIRSIDVKLSFCNKPVDGFDAYAQRWRLFADDNGGVYFMTSPGRNYRLQLLLYWPPGANGNVRPQRALRSNMMFTGVQGVDQSGNIWFAQGSVYYFGLTAKGPTPTGTITLPGSGVSSLALSPNGLLVYITASVSKARPLLVIRPEAGGAALKTIDTGGVGGQVYEVPAVP